jgi:SAM-dependent methyltransferase
VVYSHSVPPRFEERSPRRVHRRRALLETLFPSAKRISYRRAHVVERSRCRRAGLCFPAWPTTFIGSSHRGLSRGVDKVRCLQTRRRSGPLNKYTPREFWTRLAKDFGERDLTGFGPVLHPGTPSWFNKAIDRLQNRIWNKTLSYCCLSQGARVLDVGSGTGRWVRRLEERGLSVVGMDQSSEMLFLARNRGTLSPLVSGEGQNLPFRDESFECVSAVTVIQHIPPQEQIRALSEMVRVLRPGGYLFLIELIRGHGLHVFSRPPDDWIGQVSMLGVGLVSWRGHEYFLFDRAFVYSVQKLRALAGYPVSEDSAPHSGPTEGDHQLPDLLRRVYWTLRRGAVALSVCAEPLFERVCPSTLATHGVFLFRKQQTLD